MTTGVVSYTAAMVLESLCCMVWGISHRPQMISFANYLGPCRAYLESKKVLATCLGHVSRVPGLCP